MTARRQIAVLGLGRFGQTVARELTRIGHDVLAIDSNEHVVRDIAADVTHAVEADITDEDTLRDMGVAKLDVAIVAISSSLETSVLTTVLLKRLGVQRIVAKAASELHGSILEQLGVTRVVHPDRELGIQVAHSFAAPGVLDYFDVAPGYGFARVGVAELLAGKQLRTLDVGGTYGVATIALRRGNTVTLNPDPSEVLRATDELIVAGLDEDLERLPSTVDTKTP